MANKFVKRIIEITDYQTHILEELRKGVVLTTSDAGRINAMSISWGMLGVEWNKPIFITFVRTGRFTHELLTKNPQFTVNIPQDKRPQDIISYLGRHSGRTEDKITSLGLHTVESPNVNVCGIAELPLTLECRMIYRQTQDIEGFICAGDIPDTMYPKSVDSSFYGNNRDLHTAFYGEIVGAYIIENED